MQIMWFNLFLYVLYCSSQELVGDLINFLQSLFFRFIDFKMAGVNQGDLNLFICLPSMNFIRKEASNFLEYSFMDLL